MNCNTLLYLRAKKTVIGQGKAEIHVRSFRAADQEAARNLILAGMEERWGWLDETKNRDLDDIGASYANECFLVAIGEGEVQGTGGLIHEKEGVVRIVRMSVARSWRRQGVGGRLLEALLTEARAAGYRRVVLETEPDWTDALSFYKAHGFQSLGVRDGNMHFTMDLA